MQSKAKTIPDYIATLSPGDQKVIAKLDALVRELLPRCEATMKYGMPTYEWEGRALALNAQKNYFSLYVDPLLVKRHAHDLKTLDVGKSCIRFSRTAPPPWDVFRKIISGYGE